MNSTAQETPVMDFTSSVEDVDAVTKKITVSIPAEAVTKEINSAITKFGQTVRIKGFREGKAPRAMVERMYGERVRAEVHNDLVAGALRDAAQKHEINIVGSPQVNLQKIEAGKPFEFAADVSVYPKPEVSGYDAFEISVPKREVSDGEVNEVVEYLRKNKATMKPLEGRTVLQKGDVGQAEFVVTEEGGEPSSPEPYSFCLGEGQLPKEVEEAYEGMSVGETREAVVGGEAPKEGEQARKKVSYKGTLKAIFERVLPEVDDSFAKQIEPGVAGVLEMRLKIRENLEKEREREHISDVNAAVLEKLIGANEFQVPQVLIDDEIRGLLVSRGFIDPQKLDVSQLPMEMFRKELSEPALRRVRAAILIDRIVEKEGLKLSKEDMEQSVRSIAAANNMTVAEAQKTIFQRDRAMSFMVETLRNKGLEFLRGKAKISYSEPASEKKK